MQATLPGISHRAKRKKRADRELTKEIDLRLFGGTPTRATAAFDPGRAVRLYEGFLRGYETGHPLYVDAVERPPEARAIEGIASDREKAQFLHVAISLDRNTSSEVLYRQVRRAYEENPLFVSVPWLTSLEERTFYSHLMERFGVGMEKTKAQEVYRSFQTVQEEAAGDIREYLAGYPSIYDAAGKLETLPGFGPNLPRLLLHNLVEQQLMDFPDADRLGPKVDVHCQALSLAHGIARIERPGQVISSTHLGKVLREGYDVLAREGRIDGRFFNKVLWAVGSKACSLRDWRVCRNECPLVQSCGEFPYSLNSRTGYFVLGFDPRDNPDLLRNGFPEKSASLWEA